MSLILAMPFLVIAANRYEQGWRGDNWRASRMVLQRWTNSSVSGDAGYSVVIPTQMPPVGGVRKLNVKKSAICVDCGESIVSEDGGSDVHVGRWYCLSYLKVTSG